MTYHWASEDLPECLCDLGHVLTLTAVSSSVTWEDSSQW